MSIKSKERNKTTKKQITNKEGLGPSEGGPLGQKRNKKQKKKQQKKENKQKKNKKRKEK